MKNKLDKEDKVDLLAMYLAIRWISGLEEIDTTQDVLKAKELLDDEKEIFRKGDLRVTCA